MLAVAELDVQRAAFIVFRLVEEYRAAEVAAHRRRSGSCMKATSVWRRTSSPGLYRVISGGAIFTGKAKFSNSSLRTSAAWSSWALR